MSGSSSDIKSSSHTDSKSSKVQDRVVNRGQSSKSVVSSRSNRTVDSKHSVSSSRSSSGGHSITGYGGSIGGNSSEWIAYQAKRDTLRELGRNNGHKKSEDSRSTTSKSTHRRTGSKIIPNEEKVKSNDESKPTNPNVNDNTYINSGLENKDEKTEDKGKDKN